jgi:hypothetical protein
MNFPVAKILMCINLPVIARWKLKIVYAAAETALIPIFASNLTICFYYVF